MTAAPKFMMLKLADVVESPLNPRKEFDKTKLAELTASVKERGVLEPILVRPKDELFEVAAGARRFRAAKAAGLKEIPAMVREMSDAELLEVALLENVVRHDITALEEGDALRALQRDHGYTVEKLIEKTGKSRTVVFQRMKLAELQGEPRKTLAEGKLSASVAELIARLPTAAAQEAALAKLRKECHYKFVGSENDVETWDAKSADISRMPFRDARNVLDGEFRLVLAKAPFDTKTDDWLDGDTPACVNCPKRTGADKEAFPDVKADTCLDAACWTKKSKLATKQLKGQLEAEEKRVVKESNIFDQYDKKKLSRAAAEKYARPGEKIDGKKTLKDLLGKDTPMVTVLDKNNDTHNLIDRKAALALLKEKDPKAIERIEKLEKEDESDNWEERNRKQQEKYAAQERVRSFVWKRGLASVTKMDVALKLMITALAGDQWEWNGTLSRAGLPAKTKPEKLKPADTARLLVATAYRLARGDTLIAAMAKLAKIDIKKLEKKAAAAVAGTCFVCGCTEDKACDGGCSWTDEKSTLCTACVDEEA